MAGQGIADPLQQQRVVELDRGEVDRYRDLLGQGGGEGAGGVDHVGADADDGAVMFGGGDELVRWQDAVLRMLPADQRLDRGDRTAFEPDDRLELEEEALALELVDQRGVELAQAGGLAVVFGIEHAHGAAPAFLGAVECQICRVQDILGLDAGAGDHRDAGATADRHGDVCQAERIGQAVDDAAGHRLDIGDGGVGQQDREFVAAEAEAAVVAAHAGEQPAGGGLEQLVARLVAEAVVHRFEMVEIEADQPGAGTHRAGAGPMQHLVEAHPVAEAGQAVMPGDMGDAPLGVAVGGDVGADAAIADELAIAVEDRLAGEGPAALLAGEEQRRALLVEGFPPADAVEQVADGRGAGLLGAGLAMLDQEAHQRLAGQRLLRGARRLGEARGGAEQGERRIGFPEKIARTFLEIAQQEIDHLALAFRLQPAEFALHRVGVDVEDGGEGQQGVAAEADQGCHGGMRRARHECDGGAGGDRRPVDQGVERRAGEGGGGYEADDDGIDEAGLLPGGMAQPADLDTGPEHADQQREAAEQRLEQGGLRLGRAPRPEGGDDHEQDVAGGEAGEAGGDERGAVQQVVEFPGQDTGHGAAGDDHARHQRRPHVEQGDFDLAPGLGREIAQVVTQGFHGSGRSS